LENNDFQLSSIVPLAIASVDIDGAKLNCSTDPPLTETMNIALVLKHGCPNFFWNTKHLFDAQWQFEAFNAFGLFDTPLIRLELPETVDLDFPTDAEFIQRSAVGQGDLTITPVQIARAYGALVGDGKLTPLHLIDAVENPDGSWNRLLPVNTPTAAVDQEVAKQIASTAISFGDGIRGFSFEAIAGERSERLHWFLGKDLTGYAIVVILENETVDLAQKIGTTILKNSQSIMN
jgi:hypothetical protein